MMSKLRDENRIHKYIRSISLLVLCSVFLLSLSGCSLIKEKMHTSTIFAMDTIMEIEVEGNEELLRNAEEKIRTLERKLSVTDEESEIARLNASGRITVTDEVADILGRSLDLCKETDGALDITIYPVLKAWGFTTGKYRVPSDEEIEELLEHVDYRQIVLAPVNQADACGSNSTSDISTTNNLSNTTDTNTTNDISDTTDTNTTNDINAESPDESTYVASIPAGFEVDLGSVAKGYTSQLLTDYFKENGAEHALINLGGNVQCIGTKPNGQKWKVAIKSPFPDSKTGIFGVLEAADTAIITSGGYERYFEENGELYFHIIDPKTGKPAKNTLASVTIIGQDGLTCDALSTALFVKGLSGAIDFWKASDEFDAIFVTNENEVYITRGICESFRLSPEYHNATIHILSKD